MRGGFLDKTRLSKFLRLLILPVLLLVGFFVFGGVVWAETINIAENLVISKNVTWQENDKIIITAPNGVYIAAGGVLNIKPGVIIKLDDNKYLGVFGGTLNIIGNATSSVIITSLKDDITGGDDNSDGEATGPAAGDWMGIVSEDPGSIINIDYAEIKYGGSSGGLVMISEADRVDINHSSILQSQYLVRVAEFNTFNINNSNLFNPECISTLIADKDVCGIGIWNYSVNEINATNNYWGHVQGPTNFDSESRGVFVFGNINYDPFLSSAWAVPEPEPEPEPESSGPEPIIIVPGVTACINLKVLTDIEESSYDWEIFGTYYQGIIKTFETAGFILNENLFIGCYDWRKSNGYNSDETVNSGEEYLMHWIDRALENSSSTKVDIVAHSMGGLLSRSYIQSDRYRDDVNQFIMIGTPNYGSTNAYFPWEGGDIESFANDMPLLEKLKLKAYLTYLKFKGYDITYTSVMQNFIPSIKQLLPTYDYIINKDTELTILNSLMEEKNIWLKELNEAENLNKLTERATSVKIINGDGLPTRNTITVTNRTLLDVTLNKWPDGRPDAEIIDNRDNGDGTVLSSSALIEGISSSTIEGIEHSALPDQAALLVLQELGIESEQVFSSPEVNDMLIVMVASPVDPIVTTADNKQVGGSVNEIENAQYFSAGAGGVKIITIPNPTSGNFAVSLTGNGNGSYNIAIIYSSNNSTVSSEASGNVTSGQNIIYSSSLQTGANPNLGGLSLPVEESEPENISHGGPVPLWLLQEMSDQSKVLGIKINQEDEQEEENFECIFRVNLIYSPTMEEALLNGLINF